MSESLLASERVVWLSTPDCNQLDYLATIQSADGIAALACQRPNDAYRLIRRTWLNNFRLNALNIEALDPETRSMLCAEYLPSQENLLDPIHVVLHTSPEPEQAWWQRTHRQRTFTYEVRADFMVKPAYQ